MICRNYRIVSTFCIRIANMNEPEMNTDTMDCAALEPFCVDINFITVLLGISIVNEAKRQLKKPLQRANLTMNQWLVLKILFLKRANTPTKVANILNFDTAAITRHADILELRGLIERERKTGDRRVIYLQLTSKGIHTAEKIRTLYAGIFSNFEFRLMHDELKMWITIKKCIASHVRKKSK